MMDDDGEQCPWFNSASLWALLLLASQSNFRYSFFVCALTSVSVERDRETVAHIAEYIGRPCVQSGAMATYRDLRLV